MMTVLMFLNLIVCWQQCWLQSYSNQYVDNADYNCDVDNSAEEHCYNDVIYVQHTDDNYDYLDDEHHNNVPINMLQLIDDVDSYC